VDHSGVEVGVGTGVLVRLGVGLLAGGPTTVCVGVAVADSTSVGVTEADPVAVGSSVASSLGDGVGVADTSPDAVADGLGVVLAVAVVVPIPGASVNLIRYGRSRSQPPPETTRAKRFSLVAPVVRATRSAVEPVLVELSRTWPDEATRYRS
jgi:hypothetical protein